MLLNVMNQKSLFSSCSLGELEVVINAFEQISVNRGDVVCSLGSVANTIYVVQRGVLEQFFRNPNEQKWALGSTLIASSSFGNIDLVQDTFHTATIKASETCIVWVLSKQTYVHALADYKILTNKNNELLLRRATVNGTTLCSNLSDTETQEMTSRLNTKNYKPSEVIVAEGSSSNLFHIIARGSVLTICQKDQLTNESNLQNNTLQEGDSVIY